MSEWVDSVDAKVDTKGTLEDHWKMRSLKKLGKIANVNRVYTAESCHLLLSQVQNSPSDTKSRFLAFPLSETQVHLYIDIHFETKVF
jgi:hypothetical protein